MFVVDEVRPVDLGAVAALAADTLPEHYDETFFFSLLENAPSTFLVARGIVDGHVHGFGAAVQSSQLESRLLMLATRATSRGRGVGRQMLREIESRLQRRGVLSIELEVRDDNLAAIRFYRRGGYEPVGTVASFYNDGASAMLMRKAL